MWKKWHHGNIRHRKCSGVQRRKRNRIQLMKATLKLQKKSLCFLLFNFFSVFLFLPAPFYSLGSSCSTAGLDATGSCILLPFHFVCTLRFFCTHIRGRVWKREREWRNLVTLKKIRDSLAHCNYAELFPFAYIRICTGSRFATGCECSKNSLSHTNTRVHMYKD